MELKEETIKKNVVYDGKIIRVRSDDAKCANGNLCKREVVEHPGGVGIALEDHDGKFFMVKQFRYGQQEVMLEYPAGKKEYGEDALKCAKREIVEETGYEATDWVYLGHLAPTPAYCEERIDMYYAKVKDFKGQHFDDDENIVVEKYSLDELISMIMQQKISDAKTVAMTFMVAQLKKEA